ncbi:MAG: SDR family oxidoreductase [Dehalococcoidia bacterium]|nr:SDR family oxidoreductase [Dehalococcoidia bacterium]
MTKKRVALIAGGTGALGVSIARALMGAGYAVHVTAENAAIRDRFAAGADAAGVTVHVADFSKSGDAQRTLAAVGAPLGAFVTTIGGFAGGPLATLDDETLGRLMTMNLKTTIVGLREAYAYLKQQPDGASAVVVGARSALAGGAGVALYSATKAAVVNLAYSLAQEWLADGITVNAILPSTMDTPANRAGMPDADFARWPKTGEVAEVVAFLVSEKARIVSGGAIPVYGRS